MANRGYSVGAYSYGFQGKEEVKDEEGMGGGVATSKDLDTGELITTSAVQVGWGLSKLISGGTNTGYVIPLGKPVPKR